MPVFDAVCTAMSTAGTGGFGIKNASIGYYDNAYFDVVIGVFMVLFGVNFNVYYFILTGNFLKLLKCEEVKWFESGYTSIGNDMFKGWTALKYFDFGCLSAIDYNCFENTGFVDLIIPSTIKSLNNCVFARCVNLKNVRFESNVSSLGINIFDGCTNLVSVDLSNQLVIGSGMFKNCSEL